MSTTGDRSCYHPGVSFTLQAIVPKKRAASPDTGKRQMEAFLDMVSQVAMSEMGDYPPWKPWRRPPKRGPRAGGRRTGAYGRGWRIQKDRFKPWASIKVTNGVSYAVWVGGPRGGRPGQARHMRARGWKSISDVTPKLKKLAPKAGLLIRYPR